MGKAIILKGVDFSQVGLGKVTLTGEVPIEAIGIVAPAGFVGIQTKLKANIYPTNATERGVSWSIVSGGTYATIDATTGLLTVLQGASGDDVTARCTSTDNAEVYAEKTIEVTYSSGQVELIYGLRNNGLAGIATDYIPNQYTEVRATFILNGWMDYSYPTLFGNVDNSANEYMFGIWYAKNRTKFYAYPNVQERQQTEMSGEGTIAAVGDEFSVVMSPTTFTVGNKTMSIGTANTGFSGNKLSIFCHVILGQPINPADLTLLSFDIYEQNVLVAQYKPAKSDGTLGVYETISQRFYANAFSGNFTEVQDPNQS